LHVQMQTVGHKLWSHSLTDLCSKSSEELNKSYFLCANHFEQSQFLTCQGTELYNAVPTLLNVSIFSLFIAVVN